MAGGTRPRRSSRMPLARSAPTGPTTSSIRTAGRRSLHFLAAWWLLLPGAVYLLTGIFGGHFRSQSGPSRRNSRRSSSGATSSITCASGFRLPAAVRIYGVLQKCAYSFVVFVAAPLMVLTGLTMSPAVTRGIPSCCDCSAATSPLARSISSHSSHSLLFVFVHVVMVIKSGFRRQIRAMTVGRMT